MSNLRTWLELVRLPATFTAPADVLAGATFVGALQGTSFNAETGVRLLGAVVASALVYAAGMAANDYCDAKLDATERPHRPIPSGRLTRATVLRFVLALQLVAVLVGGLVGFATGVAVAATIIATWLYNGPLKDAWIGPGVMGLCRYGNACIGICAFAWPAPALVWCVPLTTLLFVAAVTAVSRFEVTGGQGRAYRAALAGLFLASTLPVGVAVAFEARLEAYAYALLLPVWVLRALRPAWPSARASVVRGVVMAGIFGIAVCNAVLAAFAGAPLVGGAIVVLAFTGRVVGRRFYST